VNATNKLRTILNQAKEEFGLKDDAPESIRVQSVLNRTSSIKLVFVQDLFRDLEKELEISVHYLGFQEGPYFIEDSIEWDIKEVFLKELVGLKIIDSFKRSEVWDDNVKSWIATLETKLNPSKRDDLLMLVNQLILAAKNDSLVRLVPNIFKYNVDLASLEFGNISVTFKVTESSHRFLDFMFNAVKISFAVDKDELYEKVFGGELPLLIKGEENQERNKRIKDLHNVKTAINIRVKNALNTSDELFSSLSGGYIRNF